ncbi:hypothetical protein DERP_004161 [Dermatophagoides pteronyssinus]|uniref:Uncharacterized protein n=1 Tax=Dermatophagoides pteronyssinus TaxID=6956 RepID=A0ABQ8J8C6_DERPT|nr:hypothetical protein DERP_004161 [Dermatophagoides pteronyssinus]
MFHLADDDHYHLFFIEYLSKGILPIYSSYKKFTIICTNNSIDVPNIRKFCSSSITSIQSILDVPALLCPSNNSDCGGSNRRERILNADNVPSPDVANTNCLFESISKSLI